MIYTDLYSKIKKDIETGIYKPGERIPHTKELVATYKISQTTVSKAVKLLEQEGLVRRIKSKGTFVQEAGTAAYLEYRKKERVGLLFDGYLSDYMDTHFMVQAYQGMEEVAKRNKKQIVTFPMADKTIPEYLKEIQSAGISGAILHSPYSTSIKSLFNSLTVPFVCVDFVDYGLGEDQVTIDHLRAGALALRTLHGQGHKDILFFGNYWQEESTPSRHHEYWSLAMAAEAKFLKVEKVLPCFIPMDNPDLLKRRMAEILTKHPEATGFACASQTYFGILKNLLEKDLHRATDKNDTVLFSDLRTDLFINDRKVFQCRWNTRDMGTKAMELLLDRLRGGPNKPQIHYLPVRIQ